ncbi:hypothetical protein ACC685_33350 [Rhizobium ruizarguesonis]
MLDTLDALKSKHSAIIPADFKFGVLDGWTDLLDRFFTSISPLALAADSGWRLDEVREKSGMLRIVCDYADPWNEDFLHPKLLAGFRSRVTCEVCGRAGFIRSTGWRASRCDEHAAPDQKGDHPRPAWAMGVDRPDGYLWFDQTTDDLRYVADLTTILMPSQHIEAIYRERLSRQG